MIRKALPLLALLGLGATANADIIDVENVNRYLTTWNSVSYTHDINDDGFTLGSAVGGWIEIEISDRDRGWEGWLPELILITIEDFDFDTGGISVGTFFNGLEVQALAALNANGLLDVTITSLLGDFYVGTSTLYVATVPEPATLALLGGGLLAFGLGRRRKLAA